eukprot:1759686-Rhodomonas_salina.2
MLRLLFALDPPRTAAPSVSGRSSVGALGSAEEGGGGGCCRWTGGCRDCSLQPSGCPNHLTEGSSALLSSMTAGRCIGFRCTWFFGFPERGVRKARLAFAEAAETVEGEEKMMPVYGVEDPTRRGEIKHATTGQARGTACRWRQQLQQRPAALQHPSHDDGTRRLPRGLRGGRRRR